MALVPAYHRENPKNTVPDAAIAVLLPYFRTTSPRPRSPKQNGRPLDTRFLTHIQ